MRQGTSKDTVEFNFCCLSSSRYALSLRVGFLRETPLENPKFFKWLSIGHCFCLRDGNMCPLLLSPLEPHVCRPIQALCMLHACCLGLCEFTCVSALQSPASTLSSSTLSPLPQGSLRPEGL